MKKAVTLLSILLVGCLLCAHEFWLQPDRYQYRRGEAINIRFWVGENFEGDNWAGDKSRINKLQLLLPGDKDDLSNLLSEEKGDSLQFSVFDECTPVIVYNSNNTFIQLEAPKFNEYLTEDGLQNAIDYRKDNNETDTAGRELYQRSVKTIVQVGAYKTPVSNTTSLPLDIIPLSHPYQLKEGDPITCRVLFNKQPLSNQLIKIWHRVNGQTTKEEKHTNEKGEISFTVSTTGKWMVSTVNMIRLQNDTAQWQSYWGSCTWGYQ